MKVPRNAKWHVLALILLLIVPLVFFWDMVVGGQEPLAPDTQFARPLSAWAQEAHEREGEVPLWCPMIFSGMPSYGSFVYTPSSPFDLTRWLREPFRDQRGARYYIYLVLGAAAVYLLLALRKRHPLSALGGALLFVMTPYMLGLVAAGHSTKLQALFLAPLVFLGIDLLLRSRRPAAAALLGFAVALQLWNNHPQISYYTLLLGGLYAILLLIWERPDAWRGRRWLCGALLGLLALAAAAALVMEPYAGVLEYMPYSIRGAPGVYQQQVDAAAGVDWDYATGWSYPPEELLCFLFPSWFGLDGVTYWGRLSFTQSTHYVGVVALLVALLGLILAQGRRKWILLILSGVVLLIGFGRHLPVLFWPMYKFLPMFSRFRVPSMIYALLPLLIAPLAAEGLEGILRGGAWVRRPAGRDAASSKSGGAPKRGLAAKDGGAAKRGAAAKGGAAAQRRRRADSAQRGAGDAGAPGGLLDRWAIVCLVLAGLLVIWLVAGSAITEAMRGAGAFVRDGEAARWGSQIGLLTGERMALLRESVTLTLLLLTLCALAIEGRRRGLLPGVWAAGLVAVFLVADLWIIDRKFYDPRPRRETEAILQEGEVVRVLREQEGSFRIAPLVPGQFQTNRYAAFGLESIGGYQPAKLRVYDDLMRSGAVNSFPVLAMLNTRFLVIDRRLPEDEFPLVARAAEPDGTVRYIHENLRAMPRAWFVREIRTTATPRALLRQIAMPDFDPAHTAWFYVEEAEALPDTFSAGEVRRMTGSAQHWELQVSVQGPAPGLLILSEIVYPPGWTAAIDGRVAPIHRANHLLRGLVVPPGEHQISMLAGSSRVRWGQRISRIGGLLLLVLLAADFLRRRLRAS